MRLEMWAIHDSRRGVFLFLLWLLFVNCCMPSHIIYTLHPFLCCCSIDRGGGTFGETIGLFDPPVFVSLGHLIQSSLFQVAVLADTQEIPRLLYYILLHVAIAVCYPLHVISYSICLVPISLLTVSNRGEELLKRWLVCFTILRNDQKRN